MNLTCSDPSHASRSALPGWASSLGEADEPIDGLLCEACTNDPTGAHQTAAAAAQAAAAVQAAQDAAIEQMRTSAQGLRDDLADIDAGLVAAGQAMATARNTFNALSLPANPTAVQVRAAVVALAAYVTATDTAVVGAGQGLRAAIGVQDHTIRGLANYLSRQAGATEILEEAP